jgi:excinuclease ABC subunit C
MDKFKVIPKNKIDELPKTTGVYLFRAGKNTIYIGKAINIQSRVKNHFNQPSYRDNLFIDKINKIGFFETNNSEIEALILEANLIKKYQPKYNVVWKDGKNYFYVAVAQNENKISYVYITHQPASAKGYGVAKPKYIGPFVEGTALKKTLRFLRRVFPYYTSAKHPKNKCTYCHLDLCPGPNLDLVEYKKNIKKLILILKGKRNAVLNSLKKEMRQASKNQDFEKAGKIRDKIFALHQVMSHTHVIENSKFGFTAERPIRNSKFTGRVECYDISNIQGKFATGSMVVFINGMPNKNLYRKFKIKMKNEPNDIAMLKEILQRRFKHSEWPYPEVILIDGGKAQLNAVLSVIAQNSGLPRSPAGSLAMTVMAIAKGRQELFIEGKKNPIPLKQLPQEIYNLIKQLDDEAHRFAITYHKKLRKNNLLQ